MTPDLSYYWEGAREYCEDTKWEEEKKKKIPSPLSRYAFRTMQEVVAPAGIFQTMHKQLSPGVHTKVSSGTTRHGERVPVLPLNNSRYHLCITRFWSKYGQLASTPGYHVEESASVSWLISVHGILVVCTRYKDNVNVKDLSDQVILARKQDRCCQSFCYHPTVVTLPGSLRSKDMQA